MNFLHFLMNFACAILLIILSVGLFYTIMIVGLGVQAAWKGEEVYEHLRNADYD